MVSNVFMVDRGKSHGLALNLGFTTLTHLFQGVSDAVPGENDWGTATTSDKH